MEHELKKSRIMSLIGALTGVWLFGLVATAAGAGLVGQCADCHTMHNSEEGRPVALQGRSTTVTGETNRNLLRYDCIACHASPLADDSVWQMAGGSRVPQVYHNFDDDLAGGNFAYISGTKEGQGEPGSRKGHNVVDLVPRDDVLNNPPGFRPHEASGFTFDVGKFTCAGSMGCHGIRGQQLDEGDPFTGAPPTYRTGLSAFSGYDGPTASSVTYFRGAHHDNYDGFKADGGPGGHPNFYDNPLAHSYRFIRGLRGYGNEQDRWRNVDSSSHNEYHGGYINDLIKATDYGTTNTCNRCHLGTSSQTSRLYVPNATMTGFCITCHGTFHSSGDTNGTSGAFLRHPSDYVIPDLGEYAAYTEYSITAPVARPSDFFNAGMTASADVVPGRDMVMCLSCHMAHAAPYDGLLRFDYAALTSGMRAGTGNQTHAGEGCLACHAAKGGAMP